MEECGEFGVAVDGNRVNVDSAIVTGVMLRDGRCRMPVG